MPPQMSEELDRLLFADGLIEDLEVEVPERHAGCNGNGFPVEVILQDRRVSARGPRATTMRPIAQSAFVDEDDCPPVFLGFFLMAGQRSRFHCWMAVSFRSTAFPTGRCGLQFNCRRIVHTCPA